jgi:Ca2+:H+ antiporter
MISSTCCIALDIHDICLCADKFGTGFTLIRSDIGGNVERLAAAYGRNTDRYTEIFSIILDEVQRGEQEGKQSETNALLWLKRCMNGISGCTNAT